MLPLSQLCPEHLLEEAADREGRTSLSRDPEWVGGNILGLPGCIGGQRLNEEYKVVGLGVRPLFFS